MKNRFLKILGLASLLTVSLCGCEEYLDVDPEFTQDADNYFNSAGDYYLALIGAYDLLQGSFTSYWVGEIASDHAIAGGEGVFDTQGLHEIDDMRHNAVNNELRNIFRWNYAGITRANFILENQDRVDFPGKEVILAEARFLRAYYYFELVKFFGGVPLLVDERIGTVEATEIDRASASDVYGQIEADLISAADVLSWSAPELGRADKGAALALLGKAHLYQRDYEQAALVLDRVITEGGYTLTDEYGELWFEANEANNEIVFAIQYSGQEGGSYDCLICLEGNAAPGFQGIRQYDGPIYGDGNSYNLPTQKLYDSFDPADPRREASVLDIEAFIAEQENPDEIEYAIGGGGHTGYYNNKYIKRLDELGLPDTDLTSPLNYKVIRYADVLLMAAEAHNRQGADGIARGYLNQVRDRVDLPEVMSGGDQLTEDIFQERIYELSGEGHRFFDLVRFDRAAEEIEDFIPGKHELFPIPQVEIDLAGGNWQQNNLY